MINFLAFGLLFILTKNTYTAFVYALGFGYGAFSIYWSNNGGIAFLLHTLLRLHLYLEGSIPLRFIRFLDFAAECILLRKVGGGYIFIHRFLLEYFANLKITSDINELNNNSLEF